MKVHLLQLPHPSMRDRNLPLAASYLRGAARAAGLSTDVEITIGCDRFANHAGLRILADDVVKRAPDVVGLSLYLWNIKASVALARAIKDRMPNTRIVIGGPEVTPVSHDLLSHPAFDAAVFGEGEIPFVALLKEWLQGNLSAAPPATACRIDHAFKLGPPNRQLIDLSSLPSPILSGDIDLEQFDDVFLFTMRGCVQGCAYCAWSARGRLRPFPLEQLKAEIRTLHDHAVRNGRKRVVCIGDSAFNTSPVCEPLCQAIASINVDKMLELRCFVLAERLTAGTGKLLKDANVTSVEIGLQSANEVALRKVCRPVDSEAFLAGVQVLRQCAIPILADAIVGLPGDDLHGFIKTMGFLENHSLETSYFNLSLGRGAPLRTKAEKMGLKYCDDPPYYVYHTPSFPRHDIDIAMSKVGTRSADIDLVDDLQLPVSGRHKRSPVDITARMKQSSAEQYYPISHIVLDNDFDHECWERTVASCASFAGNRLTLDVSLRLLLSDNKSVLQRGLRRIADDNPFINWTTLVRIAEADPHIGTLDREIDVWLRPRDDFLDQRDVLQIRDAKLVRRKSHTLIFLAPLQWLLRNASPLSEGVFILHASVGICDDVQLLLTLAGQLPIGGVLFDVDESFVGDRVHQLISDLRMASETARVPIFFSDWVLQRLLTREYHRSPVDPQRCEIVVNAGRQSMAVFGEQDLQLDAILRRKLVREDHGDADLSEVIIDRCMFLLNELRRDV